LPQAVKAVQTFELSHVSAPQTSVHVVIVPAAPTVFFEVAVAHPPVAKREVVADMQESVAAPSAPVMELQLAMMVSAAAEAVVSFVVTMVDVTVPPAPLAAILSLHTTVFATLATTALVSRVQVRIVPVLPEAKHAIVPEVPVPATVHATAEFAA
jgi:hypothetical protein